LDETSGGFEESRKYFSLAGETIEDVIVVVGDGCLEEEGKVREDSGERRTIKRDSREVLSKEEHVYYQRDCQETVFTDIVRSDSVPAIHEDL
jgi:hypothetical protein